MGCAARVTGVALLTCGAWGGLHAAEPGLQVGQAAPRFLLPLTHPAQPTARRFKLADHVGATARGHGRGVALSFTASYCRPCRAELVELARRADELGAAGLTLAVVVIDTEPEGIEAMRRIIAAIDPPFPVLADRFGLVARRYGVDTLPRSVVIDRAGVVRWQQSGYEAGAVDRLVAAAARIASGVPPPGAAGR